MERAEHRQALVEQAEAELNEWRQHPTTRRVMAFLRTGREEIKELWAKGNFTSPDMETGALANAKEIGRCQAWEDILELTGNELVGATEQ